jgi:hypothetical protein
VLERWPHVRVNSLAPGEHFDPPAMCNKVHISAGAPLAALPAGRTGGGVTPKV